MLVTLPNKNPFFSSPMPKNPKSLRERLFEGIDKDYNVINMGIVVEVLGELENFHMSREELEDTRLGKHINELRRKASNNKELATRAKSLIKRWRDLLAPESGPPPGGGNNNNNSNLVTNGNSRLNNSHSHSGSRGSSHPTARGSSRQSPRVPPANSKLSPSGNSSQRPNTTTVPSSASSQSARSNVRNNTVQSPAVSKALPGSGSRDSPVVISSGSSSPASVQSVQEISRPCSPATSSVSIIQSREASPVRVGQKRRAKDETELPSSAKCPRLNGARGVSATSSPTSLRSANVRSPRKTSKPTKKGRQQPANLGPDLKRQMLQAKTGKVKTTQELLVNLGLESKVQTSPPACHVSDLVPKEDKSELMDRFFSSQQKSESEEGSEPDLVSRPSTAAEEASSSEESSEPSRYPTPAPRESVEDILSQLPPIDSEKVLAELEQSMAEEEPEIEGLFPAFKPRTEVTSALVDDLNNGQLDHIGGIRDYQGDFKEWHQMASLPSKDGELLHILPYSLID